MTEKLTIGEFLRKEVSDKFQLDVYIGCDKENYFPCRNASTRYTAVQSVHLYLQSSNITGYSELDDKYIWVEDNTAF